MELELYVSQAALVVLAKYYGLFKEQPLLESQMQYLGIVDIIKKEYGSRAT